MKGKVSINISNINDLQTLDAILKKYEQEFFNVLEKEIRAGFISQIDKIIQPVVEETNRILEEIQANYWGSGEILQEDPTAVARGEHLAAVSAEIKANFLQSIESFNIHGGPLKLTHLSNEFVGTGSSDTKSNKSIVWLHYFLEGNQLEDNLVWINIDTYDKLQEIGSAYTEGHGSFDRLGRFGVGYMACIRNIEGFNALLKRAKVGKTFEELKHPQSGKEGRDWFNGILGRTVYLKELVILPAIERTRDRVTLKALLGK